MKLPTRRSLLLTIYFIVAVALIVLFLPQKSQQQFSYVIERPWNHSLLTAPFDIPIFRDSVSAAKLSDSIINNFVPVYRKDPEKLAVAVGSIENDDKLNTFEKAGIKTLLEAVYDDGIVDNATYNKIQQGDLPNVRFIENNQLRTVATSDFQSQRSAYVALDSIKRNVLPITKKDSIDVSLWLTPNVVLDSVENERLLQEALLDATAAIGVIQQGERIIDQGDIVTPQRFQILRTYDEMMATRDLTNTTEELYTELGAAIFMIFLLLSVYAFFYNYMREWLKSDRRLLCVLILLVGCYILAAFVSRTFIHGMLIMPFTILPILVTVFYDSRTALFVYVVELLMCLTLTSFPTEFLFSEFIAGMAAILSLKDLSRRSQLVLTAVWVFLAYSAAYFSVELMTSGNVIDLNWRLLGYFLINAVLISFAYILIFVFEKLFGFTSKVTLVELSDINNSVLQELSEQCPGTFQHSMAVSNLAAEGARKIGANVQLVRTGALYHDIGKLANPAFFTENQYGINPHDNLTPAQSARIIIDHIKEGMKRADRANLPKIVKDMITQHHGAGKAKYFYITECRKKGEENVNPADFTYPGPNPQTIEASLIMMADAVEAASRSLPDHSVEAITNLVNRIIDGQIADGLHAESPLSFRDVSVIKQAFINRLRTMYHARIAYPADIKPKAQ